MKIDEEFRWRYVNVWSPIENAYPVLFFDLEPFVKHTKVGGSLLINSWNRTLYVTGVKVFF